MHSSLDWEAVTPPRATFESVSLLARAAQIGVRVPGGMYYRSCSLSEPMIIWFDEATDLERPLKYTRCCLGSKCTCKKKLLVHLKSCNALKNHLAREETENGIVVQKCRTAWRTHRWSVKRTRVRHRSTSRTHRINIFYQITDKYYDNVESCAGRTVKGMTVLQWGPSTNN